MLTPPLEAGTKPMGFPPWSRGPLLHRGGEAAALPFGRTRGFKPLFDITCLLRIRSASPWWNGTGAQSIFGSGLMTGARARGAAASAVGCAFLHTTFWRAKDREFFLYRMAITLGAGDGHLRREEKFLKGVITIPTTVFVNGHRPPFRVILSDCLPLLRFHPLFH